ncbi:MAG: type III pantothenate kinase [Pirellulales bacterium]|nr:type III pantothenate kinase [Pirellulales bacterium]
MTHSANNATDARGVLAIDVGNCRVKLGWFPVAQNCPGGKPAAAACLEIAPPALATPAATFAVRHRDRPTTEWLSEIHRWCDEQIEAPLWRGLIASVHPAAADALAGALARAGNVVRRVAGTDLPLAIEVERPERVGIDRLLNAVAAHRLVPQGAAIVVDMGTATTVDLVGVDGTFLGGAILPGPAVAAAALHAGTAALPDLSTTVWDSPPAPLGKSTEEAIAAGLYWGAIGAAMELVRRLAATRADVAQALITGGAAAAFVAEMNAGALPVRHVPHLTLAGLNAAAEELDERHAL